jgi:hypothetical protein
MGQLIDWGEVDSGKFNKGSSGGKGGTNDKFLKLSPGNTYKVRPVGKPYIFYAYYVASPDDPKKFNRATTDDPANCIIRQKYQVEPKMRYAVNVIDRSDGKLKVLEAPPSVFDKIKQWAKASGHNPGTNLGADFEISVKVPANGDRKRTEYPTTPIVQTPFTAEEQEMLKKQGLYDLEKIFEATPQAEIEAKLYPHTASAKPATVAATAAPAAATAAAGKPNDTSDLGF